MKGRRLMELHHTTAKCHHDCIDHCHTLFHRHWVQQDSGTTRARQGGVYTAICTRHPKGTSLLSFPSPPPSVQPRSPHRTGWTPHVTTIANLLEVGHPGQHRAETGGDGGGGLGDGAAGVGAGGAHESGGQGGGVLLGRPATDAVAAKLQVDLTREGGA